MLVDRHHGHGRGNPRPGIDQDDRLSARDGDRNFTRIAVLVHAIPLAGHLTAAFIRCRRLRVGGIDHPSHLGLKTPARAKARMVPWNQASRFRRFSYTRCWASPSGPMGPRCAGLAASPPTLADTVAHLLGSAAHQAHECFCVEQQDWQGMHALNPQGGLQPSAQEVLHDRHHLALNR